MELAMILTGTSGAAMIGPWLVAAILSRPAASKPGSRGSSSGGRGAYALAA